MIKCSKCGKENVDEAIFCSDCGTKLDNGPSAQSTDIETDDSGSDSLWSLFKIRKVDESETFSARFKRHPTLYVCCVFPLIFILVISIASDANLFIKGLHPADYETNYPDEFNNLDLNDDSRKPLPGVRDSSAHLRPHR